MLLVELGDEQLCVTETVRLAVSRQGSTRGQLGSPDEDMTGTSKPVPKVERFCSSVVDVERQEPLPAAMTVPLRREETSCVGGKFAPRCVAEGICRVSALQTEPLRRVKRMMSRIAGYQL